MLKSILDYENIYYASTEGHIENSRKRLKSYTINSGYEAIKLTKEGKKKAFLVHRLVALTFLPNEEDHPEVNHIDGNKSNNALSNLEWCSRSENKQHALKLGLYDKIYTQRNTLGKKHKSTVSKYHNVGWDKSRSKWKAVIRHEGVNYFPKRFDCEHEAALHVNWIIAELGLTDRPKNIVKA